MSRKRRAVLVLLAVSALLAGLFPLQASADEAPLPDLSWNSFRYLPGYNANGFGIATYTGGEVRRWSTVMVNDKSTNRGYHCQSFADPFCLALADQGNRWTSHYLSPSCTAASADEQCIKELVVVAPSGERRISSFIGQAPGPQLDMDRAAGLPSGSTASLFDDPFSDDPHDGYAVSLGNTFRTDRNGLPQPIVELDGKPAAGAHRWPLAPTVGFSAVVAAYHEIRGEYGAPRWECRSPDRWDCGYTPYAHGGAPDPQPCVYTGEGVCGWRTAFKPNYSFELTIRTHNSWEKASPFSNAEWLTARMSEAEVEFRELPRRMREITISGAPVDIPAFASWTTKEQASQELLDAWWDLTNCDIKVRDGFECWLGIEGVGADARSMALLDAFEGLLGNRASAMLPTWQVRSVLEWNLRPAVNTGHCDHLRDGRMIGLTSTNAPVYSTPAPSFTDGWLTYKVGGLHYAADGSVFKGTYDLAMDRDFVRCLYYLTKAPIKAKVEVWSDSEQESAATTSMSEMGDFVYLRARNFTFSQPTIAAKITGKQKVITITCQKGSRQKQVTGVKPVCPRGWKLVP